MSATTKDAQSPTGENSSPSDLQSQLSGQLVGLFDLVIQERRNHYTKHPEQTPNKQAIPSIINACAATNAAISGAANLIPGPFGMLAALPEIVAIIRNQLAMIYDIGIAYGKQKFLTKELLAGIFITALGAGGGALIIMHGGKVLVRRVTLRVFQKVVLLLGGKLTQKMLKSMISKWLPIVGAFAMAVWSNHMTHEIGRKAIEILEQEIEFTNEDEDNNPFDESSNQSSTSEGDPIPSIQDNIRVQALISLMKIDGVIAEKELNFVKEILENASLNQKDRTEIEQVINSDKKFTIDYSTVSKNPEDAIGLLIDLVSLAKRDGTFHISEKMYIKEAGKLMGFSDGDLEEVMLTTL